VGRGAEAVEVLGRENPGSGAKFYAGLPLALSELPNPSPGSWGLSTLNECDFGRLMNAILDA
jgi:hypothetical protein